MSTPRQRSTAASASPAKRNGKAAVTPAVPSQTPAPRPAADDRDGWKAYWTAQGQTWRTEPEISTIRQQELVKCYAVTPDREKGIYPFRGKKLNREDIEWLLTIYASSVTSTEGLDVRGADLNNVDLSELPLSGLRGGLTLYERLTASTEQGNMETAAVQMNNARLNKAQLQNALLNGTHLEGAHLNGAQLQGANLSKAQFQGAHLNGAHAEGAFFYETQFEEADLSAVRFQGASLRAVRFTNANLRGVQIADADLSEAIFADPQGIGPRLVDVQWDGTNLAVVDWFQIKILGDEQRARQKKALNRQVKNKDIRFGEYREAVRANRQLAVALQAQGLNEEAAHFAYRAQILQRHAFWFQMFQPGVPFWSRMKTLRVWLFSWFLFLIAGYGYKPGRSFLTYFLVIFGFATAYYFLGRAVGPTLSPLGAFVFSMTSFHGRGFFPGNNISLDDPLTILAAFEALVGLIIEVTFIATLTRRFFGQ